MKIKELVFLAVCTSVIFAAQISLAFIPNVELVSLLFLVYAVNLGKRTFYIVYSFVLLEGLFYGFGFWWIMYLYIWDIIVVLGLIFKKQKSPLFFAVTSGFFGLFFGAIGTIPFIFTGLLGENGTLFKGLSLAFSYWLSGIPFDIIHCIGNFTLALVLFTPLNSIVRYSKLKVLGEIN